MGEKRRNLVVQWRDDGDWFVGLRNMSAGVWSERQRAAMRFTSREEFREYEQKTFGCQWPVSLIRFVRLVPRKVSK